MRPVGVVLADIDHFKSINDTYGHFAGDAVLCEFARRLLACMRPYDDMGRYGGEEFLIVLPGCDETAAANQAERMRLALCREPMAMSEGRAEVTASFGATAWRPGADANAETLIRIADQALYQAKNSGRNRAVALPFEAAALVP